MGNKTNKGIDAAAKANSKKFAKLRKEKKALFLQLFKSKGCSVSDTCAAVGINQEVYRRYRKDDPVFDQDCIDVKRSLIEYKENRLFLAGEDVKDKDGNVIRYGDWRATVEWLRGMDSQTWGNKAGVEIKTDGVIRVTFKGEDAELYNNI